MAKIILTADIHNGVPNKFEDTLWSMLAIKGYAEQNSIKTIIVLGDLFHDRINLNIGLLGRVYDFFKEAHQVGQNWLCCLGNHDLFYRESWKVHSLHVLRDYLKVLEDLQPFEINHQRFWVLPFVHREQEYLSKLQIIHPKVDKDDILLTHIGVNNAILNECFLFKNWSVINFKGTKFKRIFTGHFHCHQIIDEKTIYPGSPIPFRFDEGLVEHGFIVYDPEEDTFEFIKLDKLQGHPPGYLTILDNDIPKNSDIIIGQNVRVQLSKPYTTNMFEELKEHLLKLGAVSVSWRLEDKKMQQDTLQYDAKKIGTPEELFNAYMQNDNIKDFDKNLLLKLHTVISGEAEERVVSESVEDQE